MRRGRRLWKRRRLAVVWATLKLRHYMQAWVKLLARMDPLKYLFEKPALSRILDGSEYCSRKNLCNSEIHQGTGHRRSLGHAPRPGLRTVEDRLPRWRPLVCHCGREEPNNWQMNFDGAASWNGIGIILMSQEERLLISRLNFECTNNIAEYEAAQACHWHVLKAKRLDVRGDSKLVISQTNGNSQTRDDKLIPYQDMLESIAICMVLL